MSVPINDAIPNLSNEEYHNGLPWKEYLSSSQLKLYAHSPKYARFIMDNPQEQTEAMRFGSLFHSAMQLFQQHGTIDAFWDSVAIFTPPKNPKTNQSYGNTTKAYTEAYAQFLADNKGKEIATLAEAQQIADMVGTLVQPEVGGTTARQVLKLLKWGKPEVSIFYETEDGIKLKVRPDLLTSSKIIDWKTTNLLDLTEESINRAILNYGYHISASMYQWVCHKIYGKWMTFILVFVQKQSPYDCVMVDMSNYGYRFIRELEMVQPGPGALEFEKLLKLHTECTKENHWPGAETFIPSDTFKHRIMQIEPPRYYTNKFIEDY